MEKLTQTALRLRRSFCGAVLFCALTAIASQAQNLTTLLLFDKTNGYGPNAPLIQGFDGNLYGMADGGGTYDLGTIFKTTLDGTLTTMHNFCSHNVRGFCIDGRTPGAALVQGTNGVFYGAANEGATGLGNAFQMTANGNLTVLYSFCSQPDCLDGEVSNTLMQASDGNLYGTTEAGGTNKGGGMGGTIFRLTPTGTLTTLYNFCSLSNCADGEVPHTPVIQARNGNLYGVTSGGGVSTNCSSGCGTVFELSPSGTLTTLHNFNLTDGAGPSGLVQGADGNFYGTTYSGGTGSGIVCPNGCGTAFKITPAGAFTTLHNFCSLAKCSDGLTGTGLIQATDGNFYGTTFYGGKGGEGTIFRMTQQGALTTLYAFCTQPGCPDGQYPGELLQDTDGNFYGVAEQGGSGLNGYGTIFRFSTGLAPFVKLTRDSGNVGLVGGILGQGFTGTTGVFLNGAPTSFTVVSDTYIQATVPAGATSGFVTVQTPGGTLTSNVPFRVTP
jgi:uncharacterized repeat protein (TIGR03803 family)